MNNNWTISNHVCPQKGSSYYVAYAAFFEISASVINLLSAQINRKVQCGRREQTKVFQVLGNCLCLLKWSDEGWLRSLRWGELDTSPLTQHFLDKASLSLYFTVNNIPQLCIQKIKAGYTVTASCIQNRYTELNCKYFLFQHHGMELNIYAIIMCPFYSSLQIKVILSILYLCLYTNLIACNCKNLHLWNFAQYFAFILYFDF